MNKNLFFDKNFLQELGVLDWSYTNKDQPLTMESFDQWIKDGHHGSLNYLSDHRKNLRTSLKNIFPDFKSSFVFLFDYSFEKKRSLNNTSSQKLASYTLGFEGRDYHYVLKERLLKIENYLKKTQPNLKTFYSVDAEPVLERDLAYRAGLGWFGKNSMLINKDHGSYFLIAGLFTDHDFHLTEKILDTDHCGTCQECIDQCPTDAINTETRTLIAERCISTFTIEHFKPTEPPKNIEKANGEIFGCDICQDVCPWNVKKLKNVVPAKLSPQGEVINNFFINRDLNEVIEDLKNMSNRFFRKKFDQTVFKRTGRVGVLKNLEVIKKSNP